MNRSRFFERMISDPIDLEALRVSRVTESGVVDGVLVDFRHPALDDGNWEAPPTWHRWGHQWSSCGIVFPTEGQIPLEELRQKGIPELTKGLEPIFAQSGDSIRVVGVEDETKPGMDFDHLHERVTKMASLVLTRHDGSEETPAWPLYFYGSTMFRRGSDPLAYDRLAERIIGQAAAAQGSNRSELKLAGNYAEQALAYLSDADAEIEQLMAVLASISEQTYPKPIGFFAEHAELAEQWAERDAVLRDMSQQLLLRLVSHVARAAFFQARHELRPAEEGTIRARENRAKGPESQRNWEWYDAATVLWEKEPGRTRNGVASELINTGKAEEFERSSILRSLKKHPLSPR